MTYYVRRLRRTQSHPSGESSEATSEYSTRRLCFVTQWFPPEPVTVPLGVAQALRTLGWTVQVLTGLPNFPEGRLHDGFSPYRVRRDHVQGLPVLRTPLYPSHDSSAIGRLLNYSSWAITAAVRGAADLRRVDVALVYSSPATAALPAMLSKLLYGTPYVLLIQDIWPDSVFASGFLNKGAISQFAQAMLGLFTKQAYAHASQIAVISPGMVELLVNRGVPRDKLTLVYNWVDSSIYRPVPSDDSLRQSLGISEDDLIVMYAGNHGGAQGLSNLVEAAGLVQGAGIHVVFVGGGLEKSALVELAARNALHNVHFLDRRPPEQMAGLLAAADYCVVSLKDDPLFSVTMPGKLQALMASARPVIACAPGDAARIVEAAHAGFGCPPGDPAALARVLRSAAQTSACDRAAMGASGRQFYEVGMSEHIGASRLAKILELSILGIGKEKR